MIDPDSNRATATDPDGMWDHLPAPRPWGRIFLLFLLIAGIVFGGIYALGTSQRSTADSLIRPSSSSGNPQTLPRPTDQSLVATTTTPSASPGLPNVNVPTTCSLEKAIYPELGFLIGQPTGWQVSVTNGVIHLHLPNDALAQAFVYPIRLKIDVTVDSVTIAFIETLTAVVVKNGGTFSVTNGVVAGSIAGTPIRGELLSKAVGNQLVLYGGWTPQARWDELRPAILGVGTCYEEKSVPTWQSRSAELVLAENEIAQFQASIPAGWRLAATNSRQIDITPPTGGGQLSSFYMKDVLGNQNTDGMIDFSLLSLEVTNALFVATHDHPVTIDQLGTSWEVKSKELTGDWQGQSVRGLITAAVYAVDDGYGYGTYSGFVSVILLPDALWEKFLPVLAKIQTSLTMTNSQPGKGLVLPISLPTDTSLYNDKEWPELVGKHLGGKSDPVL